MSTYAKILDALGDPTRRAIVETLRGGPRSVSEVAADLPVSRPAVSQHLRVLERAGLVGCEKRGTRRIYRLERAGLAELRAWVDRFWDDVLSAFEAHANEEEDDDE